MSIIFFVLPITLVLSLSAVAAFSWATRAGQFDDLQTPAVRALHDATPAVETNGSRKPTS